MSKDFDTLFRSASLCTLWDRRRTAEVSSVLAQNLQRESQEKANLLLRLREEVDRRGRLRDAMRQKNYCLGVTHKVNGAALGSIWQGG